jgi:hypothetical protein
MNANELADELAFKHIAGDDSGAFSSKIITMLRQQQAEIDRLLTIAEDFQMLIVKQKDEIEALKILVDELAGYKASYENCHRMCSGYGMN